LKGLTFGEWSLLFTGFLPLFYFCPDFIFFYEGRPKHKSSCSDSSKRGKCFLHLTHLYASSFEGVMSEVFTDNFDDSDELWKSLVPNFAERQFDK